VLTDDVRVDAYIYCTPLVTLTHQVFSLPSPCCCPNSNYRPTTISANLFVAGVDPAHRNFMTSRFPYNCDFQRKSNRQEGSDDDDDDDDDDDLDPRSSSSTSLNRGTNYHKSFSCSTGQYPSRLDSAFFGTTFAHIFFMAFPTLVPKRRVAARLVVPSTRPASSAQKYVELESRNKYVPKIFGFRVHHSSPSLGLLKIEDDSDDDSDDTSDSDESSTAPQEDDKEDAEKSPKPVGKAEANAKSASFDERKRKDAASKADHSKTFPSSVSISSTSSVSVKRHKN
jgi:hypothetical protein